MIGARCAHCRAGREDHQTDEGSIALELVFVAPILILALLVVIGLGRMAMAREKVNEAAAEAARAASLERDTGRAAADARVAVGRSLGAAGIECRQIRVQVETGDYRPGGRVVVTITCVADLSDLTLTGLPGHKSFTATSVVPIETFRSR